MLVGQIFLGHVIEVEELSDHRLLRFTSHMVEMYYLGFTNPLVEQFVEIRWLLVEGPLGCEGFPLACVLFPLFSELHAGRPYPFIHAWLMYFVSCISSCILFGCWTGGRRATK